MMLGRVVILLHQQHHVRGLFFNLRLSKPLSLSHEHGEYALKEIPLIWQRMLT